jgi:hypothetical protein
MTFNAASVAMIITAAFALLDAALASASAGVF